MLPQPAAARHTQMIPSVPAPVSPANQSLSTHSHIRVLLWYEAAVLMA